MGFFFKMSLWSWLFFFALITGCTTIPTLSKGPQPTDLLSVPTPNEHLPGTEFNIPIVVNKDVEQFIHYFQTKYRKHFVRYLERSSRYIPAMREILDGHELPTDLVYLAMIESGFNTQAHSYRNAVGPWQFIQRTAKRFGLQVNWWVDERRDPLKSTVAASQFLKYLYDLFDSWFLAAAGYNAGENKIKRAILRRQSDNFWDLKKTRFIRSETKQYVPKLIAAMLIAKDPEKYGFFDLNYHEPLKFDVVPVENPLDLRDVARLTGVNYDEIQELNPELKRWCTPPDVAQYNLRIPAGTKDQFLLHYEEIKPKEKTIFHTHKIHSGDTLYRIALRYKTDIHPIMELNNIISSKRLRPGEFLIIPIRATTDLPVRKPIKT